MRRIIKTPYGTSYIDDGYIDKKELIIERLKNIKSLKGEVLLL